MSKKTAAGAEEEVDETADEVEETDTEDTEDETAEDTEEEEAEDETDAADETEESEDEEESDSSNTTDELDLDAELEKEKASGEPDPKKAQDAFKERKNKQADGGKGKPITQADLDAFAANIRKEADQERALEYAKEMAGSDKEAQLIVAKWSNRTYPKNLTLREQISEAFVVTHSKKLIGERNEAMRGLKGKKAVKKDAAGTHRDAPKGNEPKLAPADAAAIRASGFVYNNVSRQYEKKLPNGRVLVRDNKTKQVRMLPKK